MTVVGALSLCPCMNLLDFFTIFYSPWPLEEQERAMLEQSHLAPHFLGK